MVVQTTMVQSSEPTHGKGRMLRTARYAYILYDWGRYREQLFDLERDPGERVNLAVDARFANVLEDHRRRLYAWMKANGDRIASGEAFDAVGVPGFDPPG